MDARSQSEPHAAAPRPRGDSTGRRDGTESPCDSTRPAPGDAGQADYREFVLTPGRGHGEVASRAGVEAACAKVVASDTFRHSRRHRTFLEYVVRAVLDGRGAGLKEVTIGLDVFGRALNGYDPDRDSIVRVEARRLRMKLQRYYAGEGTADTLEIRLPVGSYAPTFDERQPGHDPASRGPLFVVLPFVSFGDDPQQQAMAIGLADQLIDLLGSQSGVRVVAPLAASRLREQAVGLDALRRVHAIDFVIDGSIVCSGVGSGVEGRVGSGSRLRCIAHLSRTRDAVRLWSGRFDFDGAGARPGIDTDLFAFQDRVADELFRAAIDHRSVR